MRWIVLATGILAAMLAARILWADLRRLGSRGTFRSLAGALLSLGVLGAGLYGAHWLGYFSIPVVAAVFVPFGLAARWSLLASREARDRREAASPPEPAWGRQRMRGVLGWPVFVGLVLLVAALGAGAAVVAAWH
jgi:hypothetical protein